MNYNKQRLGNNIRALRKKGRLSANELAKHISVAPSYLGLIERGQRGIRIEKLCEVCSFFNVSLDNIVSLDLTAGLNVARENDSAGLHAQIEEVLRGASEEELALALKVLRDIMAFTENSKGASGKKGKTDYEIKY